MNANIQSKTFENVTSSSIHFGDNYYSFLNLMKELKDESLQKTNKILKILYIPEVRQRFVSAESVIGTMLRLKHYNTNVDYSKINIEKYADRSSAGDLAINTIESVIQIYRDQKKVKEKYIECIEIIMAFISNYVNDIFKDTSIITQLKEQLALYVPVMTGESLDKVLSSLTFITSLHGNILDLIISFTSNSQTILGNVAHTNSIGYGNVYTPVDPLTKKYIKVIKFTEKGAYYLLSDSGAVNNYADAILNYLSGFIGHIITKINKIHEIVITPYIDKIYLEAALIGVDAETIDISIEGALEEVLKI